MSGHSESNTTDDAIKTLLQHGLADGLPAIAEMYLQGVSTRRVESVMKELCGLEVSSTQVSRLTAELDDEFEKWRNRPLPEIRYLVLDATYIKVRLGGAVRDCAVLTAIGIRRSDGKRLVLGVSAAVSEAEPCRRRLRTSNMCESLNLRIKRRTRVAGLFPNEASVLRLVTAILMETSEEWETGRAYLFIDLSN